MVANTELVKLSNSTMLGNAMRFLPVKNSASSQLATATLAGAAAAPQPDIRYDNAPRNSPSPMVTNISLNPVISRNCSSSALPPTLSVD